MTDGPALITETWRLRGLGGTDHGAHREHGVLTTKAQRHKDPTGIYHRGLREHGVLRVHFGIEVPRKNSKFGFSSVYSVFSAVGLALEVLVWLEVLDGGGAK